MLVLDALIDSAAMEVQAKGGGGGGVQYSVTYPHSSFSHSLCQSWHCFQMPWAIHQAFLYSFMQ